MLNARQWKRRGSDQVHPNKPEYSETDVKKGRSAEKWSRLSPRNAKALKKWSQTIQARAVDLGSISDDSDSQHSLLGEKADSMSLLSQRLKLTHKSVSHDSLTKQIQKVPITKWSRKLFGSEKAVENEIKRTMESEVFVIHPFSKFRFVWDLITSTFIVASMVIIPFDTAFARDKESIFPPVMKLFLDVWFLVDILLNFRTGIYVGEQFDQAIELDPKIIQQRYLETWFALDFLASFPFDYVVSLFFLQNTKTAKPTKVIRLLRITKILSLIRIARVPRLVRGLHRWEEIFNLQYDVAVSTLRLVNLVFIIFLTCHVNGCLQYMIPMFYDFPADTWVAIRGLNHPNITVGEAYSWSLFKSTSHMLCIGFSTIIPRSLIDLWTTMISQISGAVLFAVFISNAINLMEEMDISNNAYKVKISQIGEYLSFRRVPTMLKTKVSDYFDVRYAGKLFDEEEILSELSVCLRREVIWFNCATLIQSVPLFEDISDDFVASIGEKLFFTVFTPEDILVRQGEKAFHMFFILKGTALIFSRNKAVMRKVGDGMHFGETCMLEDLRRAASVKALSNIHVYTLHRFDFQKIAAFFPEDFVKVKDKFRNLKVQTTIYEYMRRNKALIYGSDIHMQSTESV